MVTPAPLSLAFAGSLLQTLWSVFSLLLKALSHHFLPGPTFTSLKCTFSSNKLLFHYLKKIKTKTKQKNLVTKGNFEIWEKFVLYSNIHIRDVLWPTDTLLLSHLDNYNSLNGQFFPPKKVTIISFQFENVLI